MIYIVLSLVIFVCMITVPLFHWIQGAGRLKAGLASAIAVFLLFWTLWNSVYQVPAGHAGIVYEFGAIVGQTGEGLQWVLPWKSVYPASIQVQRHRFDKLDSFSRETQDVFVAATINTQVSPENIQTLYRNVGPNYFSVLVVPRVLQAFKDETVKYLSVDIAPHRENIRHAVRERLTRELSARSISVEDLLIDNISFSKEFQASIERKQVETQNALAAEQAVVTAKHQASQAIEAARGQAEALWINAQKQAEANERLAASITPELIQYQMVHKLAPNVSVMMMPTGAPFILSPEMMRKPGGQ